MAFRRNAAANALLIQKLVRYVKFLEEYQFVSSLTIISLTVTFDAADGLPICPKTSSDSGLGRSI